MIIKGSARKSGASALANHLGNATDNEKVSVLSITGTMAQTMLVIFPQKSGRVARRQFSPFVPGSSN